MLPPDASSGLEWRERYQIIKGICEGLHYLHGKSIVHLELKPQNVLLDDNMVPKIAGFCLSRHLGENQRQTTQNMSGSRRHMAQEYMNTRVTTFKSDIYSLGFIITMILAGRKGFLEIDKVRNVKPLPKTTSSSVINCYGRKMTMNHIYLVIFEWIKLRNGTYCLLFHQIMDAYAIINLLYLFMFLCCIFTKQK
ncbi:hypothetical protein HU200_056254 [Digitaria exilis]|uniref:non-specific serine/threonine protein kinase n=1 Tax=Digitaria exilis TaxID=1010633 RepID=A0A835E190_9POAL|nr:hypothetical protein HU200_056254 [Digitaria exilis]